MARQSTILIVDDEPIIRSILEGLLSVKGYNVVAAGDGLQAIKQVAESPPDLILLDVMMPEMNGFEVCQRLKAGQKTQHIPIILVTALDSKEDLARGLDAGADDFLPKPFDNLELLARVRSMLRVKKQYDQLETQRRQLAEALEIKEKFAQVTAHHLETLEILHDVGLRLMSNLDTDSVLSLISQVALEIIPNATLCVMHLVSDNNRQLLPVVFSVQNNTKLVYPHLGIEKVAEHVIKTKNAVTVPNIFKVLPNSRLQFKEEKALLSAPLFDNQNTVGVLSVLSPQAGTFR